ncbi:hypothetical protein [Pseudothauera hydrothermalis]|uniref:hypothetical protein n=1 Tax=Pseudothauera hydrothermalis TaxID=2184083 RepID=UPI000E09A5CF|nr:hypothetical protein [Pseudothauera hydrothermalis]
MSLPLIKPTRGRVYGLQALYSARAKSPDGNGGALAACDLAKIGCRAFDLALLIETGCVRPHPMPLANLYQITALGCAWLEAMDEEPEEFKETKHA